MKDLIIVGAGGFGREAYYIAKEINRFQHRWNIKGFIAGNMHELDNIDCDCPIIGIIEEWVPNNNEEFVMGISAPKVKERLSTLLIAKGAVFTTLIHPSAIVNEKVKIGNGCVISGRASIGDCVEIGNFVHVAGSMIGQDSIIGDYSTTTGFANIVSAYLGKRVMVGSHAVVLNNIKVGDDAVIGTGSIVFRNVKAHTTVVGNPAKKIEI